MVILAALTIWEAARLAAAQRTVAHGFAAGLVAGVAASLALTVLLVAALRTKRSFRLPVANAATVVVTVSLVVAFEWTAPPTVHVKNQPFVVTSGITVAGMAYTATFGALLVAVIGWASARVVRNRRIARASTGAPVAR
ncbi:MAG TPA: hypothetical protein VFN50_05140 [Acidimicrobiales bacterium]|nr:hypothetical protein [Acidimicrobiales bacterium]